MPQILRARINLFGHVGDGNVHYNLSPPVDQKIFLTLKMNYQKCLQNLPLRGSFAAVFEDQRLRKQRCI